LARVFLRPRAGDAANAGRPRDVTQFNGTHNAAIQVLSTRNFLDLHGPLLDVRP
jgi:hypothetical protein